MNGSVTGAGVVAAFHTCRVLPLMRRERHLDEMVPGASLARTVLRSGELNYEAVQRHIKLELECAPDDVALDLHPLMQPYPGFIEMVRDSSLLTLVSSL